MYREPRDYCRNRTYKSKTSGIVNNLSSEKGTTADNRKSMTYVLDKDATSPDRYNYNIETTEKEGVWIPAHAARYFCEFYLLQDTYRRCGLPLNPSRKENASIDFNEKDTPYAFENRLMIMVNGQEQRLVNYFYINNITNLHESEAIEQGYMRDCFGHPTVSISIMNMEENYLPIQMIAQTILIPKVRKGTQRAKQLGFLEMAFTANNIEKNTGAIMHNRQISQNLRNNKSRGRGETYGGMVAHDHVNGWQAIA